VEYESVNPYDGKSVQKFAAFSDAELEVKIAKAAELMRAAVDKFAKHATVEMGKLINEARGEVSFSANILAYYAKNSERFLAPVKLHPTHGEAHVESSPIAVTFAVEPWNFPYYQLARVAGPHLMAGNRLLVKPAGGVPQCAIAFEKLTGSVAAGRSISARAGSNLKVSSMELGGTDAFIVLEDADLEKTVPWAVWGRMFNAGQLLRVKAIHRSRRNCRSILAKFKTALEGLKPCDTMDEKTTHGPLSSEAAPVGLLQQVDSAVAKGAKLAMGGKRIERGGSFMQATILTDVKADNPAFRDEFFGPVAMFFRVKDEAAAIALANDSDFGLGGSVFTKDIARGKQVASQVDTGMKFINNIDWSDAELPFGAIKDSGYGRELGNMGIQEFVNKKLVRLHDMAAPLV
jgi:succinate-semialdehyde dehydrogenase/glutarate-semialdehyde dehydrogenase